MDSLAELLVPLAAVICIFGLPVTAFIVTRVLAHQERVEMIRHGIVPPPSPRDLRRYAKFGTNYGQPSASQPPPDVNTQLYAYEQAAAQAQLRKGIVVAFVGLALLIGLSFIDVGQPGPWLLGGLIPLFVGIAQIVIALMSGARFGAFQTPYNPPPLNGREATQQAPRDVTPGTYSYRPGSTTELERPSTPPDINR
ncbi:MAG: hypothetical protein JOZ97_06095 [Candidatus Eremiobacteraeota bacterium]|nr:hypothetical protein [Candidatus Eremiobacteraeota bacterium]